MAQSLKVRNSSHCRHKVAQSKLASSAVSRLIILNLKILYQAPAISEVQTAAHLMSLHRMVSNSTALNSKYPALAVSEIQVAALPISWNLRILNSMMLNLRALNSMILNSWISNSNCPVLAIFEIRVAAHLMSRLRLLSHPPNLMLS